MTRISTLLVALLSVLASCGGPQVLTTGQRATAESAIVATAGARGTCGPEACD